MPVKDLESALAKERDQGWVLVKDWVLEALVTVSDQGMVLVWGSELGVLATELGQGWVLGSELRVLVWDLESGPRHHLPEVGRLEVECIHHRIHPGEPHHPRRPIANRRDRIGCDGARDPDRIHNP